MLSLQQYVLRLDISVDDPLAVGKGQCTCDFLQQANRISRRERPFASKPFPKGLARHVGHDVVKQSLLGTGTQNRENVRVLEARRQRHLLFKPGGTYSARVFRRKHLDHDSPIEGSLYGEEETTHTAPLHLRLEAVGIAYSGLDSLKEFGHGSRLFAEQVESNGKWYRMRMHARLSRSSFVAT
jgi:hypothetical protein